MLERALAWDAGMILRLLQGESFCAKSEPGFLLLAASPRRLCYIAARLIYTVLDAACSLDQSSAIPSLSLPTPLLEIGLCFPPARLPWPLCR